MRFAEKFIASEFAVSSQPTQLVQLYFLLRTLLCMPPFSSKINCILGSHLALELHTLFAHNSACSTDIHLEQQDTLWSCSWSWISRSCSWTSWSRSSSWTNSKVLFLFLNTKVLILNARSQVRRLPNFLYVGSLWQLEEASADSNGLVMVTIIVFGLMMGADISGIVVHKNTRKLSRMGCILQRATWWRHSQCKLQYTLQTTSLLQTTRSPILLWLWQLIFLQSKTSMWLCRVSAFKICFPRISLYIFDEGNGFIVSSSDIA